MVYQTKRLELKILTEAAADMVLQFYLDNQEVFEEYETDRPQQFYTEPFQRMLLQCEYNLAVGSMSRGIQIKWLGRYRSMTLNGGFTSPVKWGTNLMSGIGAGDMPGKAYLRAYRLCLKR